LTLKDGSEKEAVLKEATEEALVVTTTRKEKKEGNKKKETIIEDETIPMTEIKETKIVISFK
jgi:ribosome maturation factor RimP